MFGIIRFLANSVAILNLQASGASLQLIAAFATISAFPHRLNFFVE